MGASFWPLVQFNPTIIERRCSPGGRTWNGYPCSLMSGRPTGSYPETGFEAMSLQLEGHTGRDVGGRQYSTNSSGGIVTNLVWPLTAVLRYRFFLEQKNLAPSTINVRLAAVRLLGASIKV